MPAFYFWKLLFHFLLHKEHVTIRAQQERDLLCNRGPVQISRTHIKLGAESVSVNCYKIERRRWDLWKLMGQIV
jgi:hypothetical protein